MEKEKAMTPIEAAEHEMEERGFICDAADARAIITAFLMVAAEARPSPQRSMTGTP